MDLGAVSGPATADSGVDHGRELLAFTDAVMGSDDAVLEQARAELRTVLSPEGFVEAAAVIAAFNVVDRIADATGIPLDPEMLAMSAAVREELHLERFASSANTPFAHRS